MATLNFVFAGGFVVCKQAGQPFWKVSSPSSSVTLLSSPLALED